MFPENAKYPVPKADRRQRVMSRPNAFDRRMNPRYRSQFPVTIHVGEGDQTRVYQAVARDISDGGLLLENVDVPASETRFRLHFSVPEGTLPEEYSTGPYAIEGDVRRRDENRRLAGIQFKIPISSTLARTTWPLMRGIATLTLLVTVILVLLIKLENVYYFWFDIPVFLYSLLVGGYLLTRFVFAAFYRPARLRRARARSPRSASSSRSTTRNASLNARWYRPWKWPIRATACRSSP
jgi:hyaluronan synthase